MFYPRHFPVIIVDNFFDDPDAIKEIANSVEYTPASDGRWPGARSLEISKLEPVLWQFLFNKFFSIWYSEKELNKLTYRVNAYFQKITPFCSNPDSVLNTGWVHVDGPEDAMGAGVIYLEPEADTSCGTGIYQDPYGIMNPHTGRYDEIQVDEHKQKVFKRAFSSDEVLELEQVKSYYDSLFPPDIIIPNRYNRMVFYGHQYPHKHEYLGTKTEKERLTLVFFVYNLEGVQTPLLKMRRGI